MTSHLDALVLEGRAKRIGMLGASVAFGAFRAPSAGDVGASVEFGVFGAPNSQFRASAYLAGGSAAAGA
ncbi:MAG: hypothetical protein V4850_13705 [Myxococcota bacterium]